MKKFKSILLVLLVLTVCLSGCGKKAKPAEVETTESEPVTTEATSDETNTTETASAEAGPLELLYKTSATFDSTNNIQRTTLDTQGYPISVYFEIPIFKEKTKGYEAINAFFEQLNTDFFTPDNELLRDAWEMATTTPQENTKFLYVRNASVTAKTEDYISVNIAYDWWLGGVDDYGSDSYVFRTDTGELLGLTDVMNASEAEIKAMILAALEKKDDGEGSIDFQSVEAFDLEDFQFQIVDGKIYIIFDKYEAAYGAYGGFDIELPAELKLSF